MTCAQVKHGDVIAIQVDGIVTPTSVAKPNVPNVGKGTWLSEMKKGTWGLVPLKAEDCEETEGSSRITEGNGEERGDAAHRADLEMLLPYSCFFRVSLPTNTVTPSLSPPLT